MDEIQSPYLILAELVTKANQNRGALQEAPLDGLKIEIMVTKNWLLMFVKLSRVLAPLQPGDFALLECFIPNIQKRPFSYEKYFEDILVERSWNIYIDTLNRDEARKTQLGNVAILYNYHARFLAENKHFEAAEDYRNKADAIYQEALG